MNKKTIMLCCAAGMSTSMLVQRMKEAANIKGINVDIFATSVVDASNKLSNDPIDVVLLGPQVRYMEVDFKKKLKGTDIPLEVIDMQAYGMLNGEKVLQQALNLMNL